VCVFCIGGRTDGPFSAHRSCRGRVVRVARRVLHAAQQMATAALVAMRAWSRLGLKRGFAGDPRRSGGRMLFGICAVTVALLRASVMPLAAQGAASAESWIPITAIYEEVDASGRQVTGTLWRDANGSVRLNAGAGPRVTIDIKNVIERRWYRFQPNAGWTKGLLAPASVGPPAADGPFDDVPPRLFEGRATVQRTDPDGRVDLLVPELNHLAVERIFPDGSRVVLRNVRAGVLLDPALFEPPPGAHVRAVDPQDPQNRRFRIFRGDELQELPGSR
jgi:hypothetical protein